MEPQAAPPQPWPATALWTVQVTLGLPVPVTVAKNCRVLGVPVEGGTKAYDGETVTEMGPDCEAMVTSAAPDWEESARLVAAMVTGFAAGTEAGAT